MRNNHLDQGAISDVYSVASCPDLSLFPHSLDYVTSDDGEVTFWDEHGTTIWVDPSFAFDPENIEEVESSE